MNESLLTLQELDVRHIELLEKLSMLDAEIQNVLQEWGQISADAVSQVANIAA